MIRIGEFYNRLPPYLKLLCYYCGYMTDTPVTTDEHSSSHASVCVFVIGLYLRGVIILGSGGEQTIEIEAGFGSLLGHIARSA